MARPDSSAPHLSRSYLGPKVKSWGHHWWTLLLVLPVVAALDVPLYARRTPIVGGIPFFIWYQFVLVAFGSVTTGVVNYLQHRSDADEVPEIKLPVVEHEST